MLLEEEQKVQEEVRKVGKEVRKVLEERDGWVREMIKEEMEKEVGKKVEKGQRRGLGTVVSGIWVRKRKDFGGMGKTERAYGR